MADDEVENSPGAPGAKPATPNRDRRRTPATIEGTAEDVTPAPAAAPETAPGPEAAPEPEAAAAHEAAPSAESKPEEGASNEAPVEEHSAEEVAAALGEPSDDEGSTTPPTASKMPLVLAALGVIIVVLLGAVLYGLYNPTPNDAVAGLSRDVADLKARLAAAEAKIAPPTDLKPLEGRVAALEAKPPVPAPATDLTPIETRLTALEGAQTQLRTDLADVQQKVAAASPTTVPPAATSNGTPPQAAPTVAAAAPVDLDPIRKQIADLDAAQKKLQDQVASAPKPDDSALQKQVGDLGAGLKAVQDQVAALPKVDLAPLSGRVDDLGQKVAGVAAAVAAVPHVDLGPTDAKIAALDKRLTPIETELSPAKSQQQATEARQNGNAAETRAAPLAVTGQAVIGAIAAGKPFAAELATLEKLGADPASVAVLKPLAETGAPTQAQLLAGFEENQGKMVGASAPKPGGNVLDRMMAGAQGLVTVRPEGANPGQDPDAVVGRIGADLQKGANKAALDEWNGLPEDGRTATHAWADKLKARVMADEAARTIVSKAIAAIGAAP